MSKNSQSFDGIKYIKEAYGLTPADLDLSGDDINDIDEIERIAEKYDLTKREDFSLSKVKPGLRKAFGI